MNNLTSNQQALPKNIQQLLNSYQAQLIDEDKLAKDFGFKNKNKLRKELSRLIKKHQINSSKITIQKKEDLTQELIYSRINWIGILTRHLKEQKDIKKALAITYSAHAQQVYRNAVIRYGHNYRIAVVDSYTEIDGVMGNPLFTINDILMLLGMTVEFILGSISSDEFVQTSLHIDWSKDFSKVGNYNTLKTSIQNLFSEYVTRDKLINVIDTLKTSKLDNSSDVISLFYLCFNKYCKSFVGKISDVDTPKLVLIATFYLLGHIDIDGTFIYYPYGLEQWQVEFLSEVRGQLLL